MSDDPAADAELRQIFHDEVMQRLDEMEAALLAGEAGGAGPEVIESLFRNAHTIKGSAGMFGLEDVSTVAHAAEDVLAVVRRSGSLPAALATSLLSATSVIRELVSGKQVPIDAVLNELAASQSAMAGGQASQPAEPPPAEPPPAEPPPAEPPPAEPPPAIPPPAKPSPWETRQDASKPPAAAGGPAAGERMPSGTGSEGLSVRVPATKIDHLLDVVGEAMQDARRIAHTMSSMGTEPPLGLRPDVRTLNELKDAAIEMRTLPLKMIAGPMPRAVRDLARAEGKQVEFTVDGGDTELDRAILESLSDPLMHLLRNAVAHGIEPTAERELADKPPVGRITLRAVPRGSLVEIIVADDGRGVSPEVLELARREGGLTDLLSRPGFSSASEVSKLAGRGVGLDAVRSYTHGLGGRFQIRSEPGAGTEVSLVLPLAVALLEVLMFERAGLVIGVPLAAAEEGVLVSGTATIQGRLSLNVRGKSLPVADVAELLGVPAPPLVPRPPALIIAVGGRRIAVACDALIGQEEVIVKPLGSLLGTVTGYLGAALLSDDRIALLVDPAMLVRGRSVVQAARPAAAHAAEIPTILVVEDSFTVRELQRSILEAAGYPVVTARDGRDALSVLSRDPRVALVVTDLEMPELDGIGLIRAIRADPARSALPVIIVTSHGSEEERRRGIEAGADAYMAKRSFNQQALLATVEGLIGR
jgi:two-component system, chemotaxis family, sensor kinase CheA